MRSVVLCAVLFATAASASEPEPSTEPDGPRTFVGLVPIPFGQGVLAVDGERILSPKLSVRLGVRLDAELFWYSSRHWERSDARLLVVVEPGLRSYLTGTALDGLWVGPHLELSCQWVAQYGSRTCSAGVATLVGYSMVVARGLTVQAGAGLGVSYLSREMRVPILDPFSGELGAEGYKTQEWTVSDRVTLAVGWAF